MRTYDTTSRVEEIAVSRSGRNARYAPGERIDVIEVPDFPTLGKLAALRFIEWVLKNPDGVISLPTGKTPEYFISFAASYLATWSRRETQRELASWGIDVRKKPDMRQVVFVQIDEFYPMNPRQENSFASFIRRFYLRGFGIPEKRALLMDTWHTGAPTGRTLGEVFGNQTVDLSLRHRQPVGETEAMQAAAIAAADQMAMEYEARIEELGGIGFFLGGIGPDGHIGFNIRGSDHFSTTRLIPINYETAAAAAADLGGIEVSRHKVVLTIGLRTITSNPTTTAIIIAAGETKAGVVKDAVEQPPSVKYPASALHRLPAARFYLTKGAARLLTERRRDDILRGVAPAQEIERALIDTAVARRKKLEDLTREDLSSSRIGSAAASVLPALRVATRKTTEKMVRRITRGMAAAQSRRFLHTAPHHDDIMLGYLPLVVHLVRNPNSCHHFATLTSGFTSVTNTYALSVLENLRAHIDSGAFAELLRTGYFSPSHQQGRNRDIFQYLDGVAAHSREMMAEGEARRALRNVCELSGSEGIAGAQKKLAALRRYLSTAYPGRKDPPEVQTFKGMIREWEEELLWAHLGFACDHIHHLRLGFYTGDIFTPQPEWRRDIAPILGLMEQTRPDVVTVAMDPESSGPDTHYKTLQAVASAVKAYLKRHPDREVEVWGYRNVWCRFHPAESNMYVPVSMNSLAILRAAFDTCFGSQRSASFPSYEYDGPFSDLAQRIMVEQYAAIKTCLGRSFFAEHPVARLRATRGICFLRAMKPDEFFAEAASLRKLAGSASGSRLPLQHHR